MWIERGLRPRREHSSERGVRRAFARASEDERGFTVLELLVAIVVIGILTAIAIPVFAGQQGSARVAAPKADLINFKTSMMSYGIANGGSFVGSQSGVKPAPGVLDRYGWVGGTPSADL